jgi:hypothetical protein
VHILGHDGVGPTSCSLEGTAHGGMAQASLRCIDFTYKKVVDREDAKIDDEGLTLLGSVGLKDQAGRPVGAPAAASSPPQTGSGARIARLGRNGDANMCGSRELFFAFSNFWGNYTGFVGALFFSVFPQNRILGEVLALFWSFSINSPNGSTKQQYFVCVGIRCYRTMSRTHQ